ncbi:hypothetical protein FA10DRAFT_269060 [Acaromyces ingoldii]|uniref:RRM domain-containing protein n=1 Tax=Acaromyces ingoldii TaxID=215250 RepID=A0A316YFB3_9BASI|nr:hypothetical protein FA10DRAFT_269060 [Acaromyces ingoldii]PWN87766.1 hypothetical protein FA10DRAFT_269060 [Acaromyces ingoldii]
MASRGSSGSGAAIGGGGGGGGRGGRRQQPRIASGARAAPYARPESSGMASRDAWKGDEARARQDAAKQWPPNQISILGRSGPTWVVVSNLLKGTSADDIAETFRAFGEIEDIVPRPAPSENHPSVAYEVAFTKRAAADEAIHKLDKALADGRLLSVSLRPRAEGAIDFDRPRTNPAAATTAAAAVPAPAAQRKPDLFAQQPPRGPRAQQQQQQPSLNTGKELFGKELFAGNGSRNGHGAPSSNARRLAAAQQGARVGTAVGKSGPRKAPAGTAPSLQSRLMTAQELQALQKRQAKAAAAASSSKGGAKAKAENPLAKRIGGLPLAMRLSEGAPKSDQHGTSSAAAAAAKKRKRPVKKTKKTAMDLD